MYGNDKPLKNIAGPGDKELANSPQVFLPSKGKSQLKKGI